MQPLETLSGIEAAELLSPQDVGSAATPSGPDLVVTNCSSNVLCSGGEGSEVEIIMKESGWEARLEERKRETEQRRGDGEESRE